VDNKLTKALFRKQVLRGEARGNRTDFAKLLSQRDYEQSQGNFFEGLGGKIYDVDGDWDPSEGRSGGTGGRTLPPDTALGRKLWDDTLVEVTGGRTAEAADVRKAIKILETRTGGVKRQVRRIIMSEALSHPVAGTLHADDLRTIAPRMYEDWDWGIRDNITKAIDGSMRTKGVAQGDLHEAATLSKQAMANLSKGRAAAANAQSKAVFNVLTGKNPEREKQIANLFIKSKGVPIERPTHWDLRGLDDDMKKGTAPLPSEKDVPWRPARRVNKVKTPSVPTEKLLGVKRLKDAASDMRKEMPLLYPEGRKITGAEVARIDPRGKNILNAIRKEQALTRPEVEWGRTPRPKPQVEGGWAPTLKNALRPMQPVRDAIPEGLALRAAAEAAKKEPSLLLDLAKAGKAEGSVGLFAKAAVGEERLGQLMKILKLLGRV